MFSLFARRSVSDEPTIKPPRVIYDRIDWSKVRPSNGDALLDKCVAARLRGEQ
jgi:hypothetical protein